MKVAVSGKGGVGKTTVAGILARTYAQRGFRVLAVDADPNSNLALSLGIPQKEAEGITPISENSDLIEQKTGVKPESYGAVFRLSFTVDDIVENYSVRGPDGVNLLVMGSVRAAGQGCMCPANALIRALLRHLLLKRKEVVVVDMEAGVEHLGRGTAEYVDVMLIVAEPNIKSLDTARRVHVLTRELGVKEILVVGNKIADKPDREMIKEFCQEKGLNLLGEIPFDEGILRADAQGIAPMDYGKNLMAVKAIQELARNWRSPTCCVNYVSNHHDGLKIG